MSDPVLIAARRDGVEYQVEHQGDRFLILHNDGAEDFALAETPVDAPGAWTPADPARAGHASDSTSTRSPITSSCRCAATA